MNFKYLSVLTLVIISLTACGNSEQASIDVANAASTSAITAVNTAAANNDASSLLITELNAIIGLSNEIAANLAAYKTSIAAASNGELDTLTEIQVLIDLVNSEQAAIAAANTASKSAIAAVNTAAANSDASNLLITDFNAIIGLSNLDINNLAAYKTAIALINTAAELDELSEIQALIDLVNSEQAAEPIIEPVGNTELTRFTFLQSYNPSLNDDVTSSITSGVVSARVTTNVPVNNLVATFDHGGAEVTINGEVQTSMLQVTILVS